MLAEIDPETTFEGLDPEKALLADLPEDSKVRMLVNKLVARQKELELEQEELRRIYEREAETVKLES